MDKVFKKGSASSQVYIFGGLIVVILLIIGSIVFFDNIKSIVTNSQKSISTTKSGVYTPISAGPFPTLDPKVTCARFTNIEQALKYPKQACILDLTGQGLSALPDDLTGLTNLNSVILNNNQFEVFPAQLLKLTKLTEIGLANNLISDLPDGISNLKKLQKLDLSNNKLTSLPKNTTYLNSIGSLLLTGNNINSTDKKRVHAFYKTPPATDLLKIPTSPASPASELK